MAGSSFVKFDGDVVFDEKVLRRLLASAEENCLCIDRNIQLESEEVKIVLDSDIRIIRVGKDIAPSDAIGESIGIEKISGYIGTLLFAELRAMMRSEENLQEYYEGAYERLIKRGVAFHAVDITGLKWTEIDTRQDFETAERIFA